MGAPGAQGPEGAKGTNTAWRKQTLLLRGWQQAERIANTTSLQIWVDMMDRWMGGRIEDGQGGMERGRKDGEIEGPLQEVTALFQIL